MEAIPIAQLSPELSALESKQFRAVVTLIWPFSSSTRQCALLLVESDFRLRRKKGQVRVRFTGSSARAIAGTGIGIGDEVVLGLRGAQFVERDTTVNTPGNSVEWDLCFSQTFVVQIYRGGAEIANLETVNAVPTPAPGSPVRQQAYSTPLRVQPTRSSESQQWSSPAFLKRTRLSDGPFFEAGYDPLARDVDNAHDKKRRRKSYRDWIAWTYSARTPSPEKDDMEGTADSGEFGGSPTRPQQLPDTPVSPAKSEMYSVAALPQLLPHDELEQTSQEEQSTAEVEEDQSDAGDNRPRKSRKKKDEDFVRDADYYDLYAGPDEVPPADLASAHEKDTENLIDEESVWTGTEDMGTIGASPEKPAGPQGQEATGAVRTTPDLPDTGHYDPAFELIEPMNEGHPGEEAPREETVLKHSAPYLALNETPHIVMPPPGLPLLQTDFSSVPVPGLLTPIGQEPRSPVIEPLDSANLPMPSPFPGGRDGDVTSYLDHSSPGGQPTQHLREPREGQNLTQEPSSEPDYILESSFYSSVSASNTSAVHPTHESAFTDVRFTFGMDGSTFSRPNDTSTTTAWNEVEIYEDPQSVEDAPRVRGGDEMSVQSDFQRQDGFATPEQHTSTELHQVKVEPPVFDTPPQRANVDERVHEQTDIIMLSSDTETMDVDDDNKHVDGFVEESEDMAAETEPEFASTPSQEPNVAWVAESTNSVASIYKELQDIDVPKSGSGSVFGGYEDVGEPSFAEEGTVTASQDVLEPTSTQRSEAVTDIIDLGSGSDTDSDEDDHRGIAPFPVTSDHADTVTNHSEAPQHGDPSERHQITTSASMPGYARPEEQYAWDDHISKKAFGLPSGQSLLAVLDDTVEESTTPVHGDSTDSVDYRFDDEATKKEALHSDWKFIHGTEDSHLPQAVIRQRDSSHDAFDTHVATEPMPETLDEESNIKIESIEDDATISFPDELSAQTQDDDADSYVGPSAELMIEVPEEGYKVGELQQKSVSATGPARNTRSKTKASTSPVKNETPAPSRTRSTRSKTSTAPTARTTLTPAPRNLRSTKSPVKDAAYESSYDLQSQPRLRSSSPTSISTPVDRQRREPLDSRDTPILTSHEEEKSSPAPDSSMFEPIEMPGMPDFDFGPSQELGTVSSTFANVSFGKDSEEGSLHSEHSLSTVPYSDDYGYGYQAYADMSDPVEPYAQMPRSDDHRSPMVPLMDASTAEIDPLGMKSPTPQAEMLGPIGSSNLEVLEDVTMSSPQRSDPLRQSVYDTITDPADVERVPADTTPKAGPHGKDVEYPELPLGPFKSEEVHVPSSPPLSDNLEERDEVTEATKDDDEAHQSISTSVNEASLMNSNMPITPNATQQSFTASQPVALLPQIEQSFPMTPQLTQTTSAGLHAEPSTADIAMEEDTPYLPLTKPPAIDATTPRRNMTTSDVASPSPSIHSEDLSDSDLETETQHLATTSSPSIGLTTPISYYTPLKDLSYFLNRSSQARANLNPDILAMVTSPTTTPKKADKGPRDWYTTCKITDLSIFPETRSVQIFRPRHSALPHLEAGDVLLLRAFKVKTLNRTPMLLSGDEGAWCVWRWSKPVWGVSGKRGTFGEVRAREEGGSSVERGEGEWAEVERLRGWWVGSVRKALTEKAVDKKDGAVEEAERERKVTAMLGGEETNGDINGVKGVENTPKGVSNGKFEDYDFVDLTEE